MIIESLPGLTGLVGDGKLKILAFASPKRLLNFPDVPTIAEVVPDFAAVGWFVLAAPAKTDPTIISKQGRDLETILTQPEFQRKLLDLATYTRSMNPAQTSEYIRSEQQIWHPVLKQVIARTR
jgi:tripartite-type tricarboxylate transporter receptor subunit TctC